MVSATPLPPAQPTYVLRGHGSQIHALQFSADNRRLLTGDADGWITAWSVAYKRPVAVWQGHQNAILGLGWWGGTRVITHGRDNKLMVWQLGTLAEEDLEKRPPIELQERGAGQPSKPKVLHDLDVNTLNFCSCSWCWDLPRVAEQEVAVASTGDEVKAILIAVPNMLDSEGIDVFHLPSEKRVASIPAEKGSKTGIIFYSMHGQADRSGMVMAVQIICKEDIIHLISAYEDGSSAVFAQNTSLRQWQKLYVCKAHTQPVLSLVCAPSKDYYLTSSADATIAKHPLPSSSLPSESAVKPLKLAATKHSGQQGLAIRSDGKIFATAGWDARVRVYAAKTMNEVAVLKWHQDGCFATAFAALNGDSAASNSKTGAGADGVAAMENQSAALVNTAMTVSERRDAKAATTHWLAAGSKDGKVSLWDIY